jgi:hypothetical protein
VNLSVQGKKSLRDLQVSKASAGKTRRKKTAPGKASHAVSFGLAGAVMVIAVAFAGHQVGQKAAAKGLPQGQWADLVAPSTTIMRKSSLLGNVNLDDVNAMARPKVQKVNIAAKSNYYVDQALITGRPDRLARLQNLITSPPLWKLERSFKLGQSKKRKIFAARRNRLAQSECLARAVYFEARSESELGQLAVAKVILNRVKSSRYPNNICGVVYQGSDRRNSCQFSFACDGQADNPKYGKAWRQARSVAKRALAGGGDLKIMATAMYYHADYVKPKWASAMSRLIKIGNHIFYRGS